MALKAIINENEQRRLRDANLKGYTTSRPYWEIEDQLKGRTFFHIVKGAPVTYMVTKVSRANNVFYKTGLGGTSYLPYFSFVNRMHPSAGDALRAHIGALERRAERFAQSVKDDRKAARKARKALEVYEFAHLGPWSNLIGIEQHPEESHECFRKRLLAKMRDRSE